MQILFLEKYITFSPKKFHTIHLMEQVSRMQFKLWPSELLLYYITGQSMSLSDPYAQIGVWGQLRKHETVWTF